MVSSKHPMSKNGHIKLIRLKCFLHTLGNLILLNMYAVCWFTIYSSDSLYLTFRFKLLIVYQTCLHRCPTGSFKSTNPKLNFNFFSSQADHPPCNPLLVSSTKVSLATTIRNPGAICDFSFPSFKSSLNPLSYSFLQICQICPFFLSSMHGWSRMSSSSLDSTSF